MAQDAPNAPGAAAILGTVVDATGRAVQGARVALVPMGLFDPSARSGKEAWWRATMQARVLAQLFEWLAAGDTRARVLVREGAMADNALRALSINPSSGQQRKKHARAVHQGVRDRERNQPSKAQTQERLEDRVCSMMRRLQAGRARARSWRASTIRSHRGAQATGVATLARALKVSRAVPPLG